MARRKFTRKQIKLATLAMHRDWANEAISSVPERFIDDGCSMAPDSIMRTSIRWACRIHDWRYCTRSHPAGALTGKARKKADLELKVNMGLGLPWYTQWARRVYYLFVKRFGGRYRAFDSCGPDAGDFCRHNMPIPLWMEALENA